MTPPSQPQNDRSCHHEFPGTADRVSGARRLVRSHLPDHPDADLVVSELATNAIVHTRTGQPGGTFTVRIEANPRPRICPR